MSGARREERSSIRPATWVLFGLMLAAAVTWWWIDRRGGLAIGPDGIGPKTDVARTVAAPIATDYAQAPRSAPASDAASADLAHAHEFDEHQVQDAEPADETAKPVAGTLETTNRFGRRGVYYVPADIVGKPAPLMVLLHGSGSSGAAIANAFVRWADVRGFIILAPDSGKSPQGVATWQVGDQPEDRTADYRHVMACIAELDRKHGVRIGRPIVAVGYSGGGSSAPYLATNDRRFSAFAVLHGGVFPGGLGRRNVRGWFSTGEADALRPIAGVRHAAQQVGSNVTFRVYPGGHALSAQEVRDVVEWWLGP